MGLGEILKLLEEAIKIKNEISLALQKENDAKRRKKLNKAIQKAIKTGKDSDLDSVRRLLFLH